MQGKLNGNLLLVRVKGYQIIQLFRLPFVPPRWPISWRHGKDRSKVCGLGRNLIRKGSWVLKVSESCFKMALSSKVRQLLMGMGAYAQTTKGFDRVAKAVSRKKMKGNTPSGAKPNYSNWLNYKSSLHFALCLHMEPEGGGEKLLALARVWSSRGVHFLSI